MEEATHTKQELGIRDPCPLYATCKLKPFVSVSEKKSLLLGAWGFYTHTLFNLNFFAFNFKQDPDIRIILFLVTSTS